jgi:hypothetical protein
MLFFDWFMYTCINFNAIVNILLIKLKTLNVV